MNRAWSASAVIVGITVALVGTGTKRAFAVDGPKVSPTGASVDLSEKKVYDQAVLDRGLPNGSNPTLSLPVVHTQDIAVDTSKGEKCFINHAEVPVTIPPVARVKGQLKIDQTVSISGFKGSFTTPSAGSDPYWIKIDFNVGDLTFKSSGALDISVECLGLDSSVSIQLKSITGSLVYSPPVKGSNQFTFKKASLKIGKISVDAIPRTKLFKDAIAKLVEEQLKKALQDGQSGLEAALGSGLGTGLGPTFGQLFLDLRFHSEVVSSSQKIKDVEYLSNGRSTRCTGSGPCAIYSIKE